MKTPAKKDMLRIEYEDMEAVRRFPKNPKLHDLAELDAAFEDRGFVEPVVVDDTSGYMIAGHGRLEQLAARKKAGLPAPARIIVKGDRWLVPVVHVALDNLEQARRHLLGSNRIAELGGWDNKLLADLLAKLGDDKLLGSGFDAGDVVKFIAAAEASNPPGSFPAVTDEIPTQFCCPRCHYAWSGDAMAGADKKADKADGASAAG